MAPEEASQRDLDRRRAHTQSAGATNDGQTPRRTRHLVSIVERQEIYRKHREHPDWSQQRLAQWASQEFARSIRQSVISNALKPNPAYGEIVRYALYDGTHEQPPLRHVPLPARPPNVRTVDGEQDGWMDRIRHRHALAEASMFLERRTRILRTPSPDADFDGRVLGPVVAELDDAEPPQEALLQYSASQDRLRRKMRTFYHRQAPLPMAPNPSDIYLPQLFGGMVNGALNYSSPANVDVMTSWFTTAIDHLDQSPPLYEAFRTILLRHAGMVTGDDRMIVSSRRSYGRALRSLQMAINSSKRPDLDIVSTTMLLGYYEALNHEHSKGEGDPFISHTKGTSRILKLTGPEAFRNDYGRKVLFAFSGQLMYSLYDSDCEYFFDQNWLAVMAMGPVDENRKKAQVLAGELYGLAVSLAAIRKQFASKRNLALLDSQIKIILLDQLYAFRKQLQDWAERCKIVFPNANETSEKSIRYRPDNSRALTLWTAHQASLICTGIMINWLEPDLDFSAEERILREDLNEAAKLVPVLTFLAKRTVFVTEKSL